MPVQDFKKYQNLAKCMNTTFGDSATNRSKTLNQSIKMALYNETLVKVTFMMIVNFGSDNMVREMAGRFKNEALSMVKGSLDRLKKDYEESTEDKIKLTMLDESIVDSYEFLSHSMYNPKKTAYYRLSCLVDID